MSGPRRPPKVPRPTPVPRVRSALIDGLGPDDLPELWSRSFPLVEPCDTDGEAVVTFCWRDDRAAEVLLFANRLTDETDLAATLLERRPGTDLWHASFRMGSDWRASYSFLVRESGRPAPWETDGHVALRAALDHGLPDPRNPATCRNRAGVTQSVVSLPDAPPQPWLVPRAGSDAGAITRHRGPDGRDVWLYDPPNVPLDDPLPLVVALDGEVWLTQQSLPTLLDNAIADGLVPPVRAALVSSGGRDQRWRDLGSRDGADHFVTEVLPWAVERRHVPPGRVVVAGQSLGALTALRVGLTRPDLCAGVVSQSASLWLDELHDDVPAPGGPAPRVHLAHGAQEWVLTGPHRRLAASLRTAGVPLRESVPNGGHDYAWWRGDLADGLSWCLSSGEPGAPGPPRTAAS